MSETQGQDPDRLVRYPLSWPAWLAEKVAKAANARMMPVAVWLREAATEKLADAKRLAEVGEISEETAATLRDTATTLRRAAGLIREKFDDHAARTFWYALADLLDGEARMVGIRGNSVEGATFDALRVARAWLNEGTAPPRKPGRKPKAKVAIGEAAISELEK